MADKRMGFFEHIDELRGRLRISVMIFALAFVAAYFFSATLLNTLWDHFVFKYQIGEHAPVLLATSVMSGFVTQLNLALIVSAALTMPVFIYEMFLFVEPALDKKHRSIAIRIMLSSIVLFIAGVSFIYFVMLPLMLEFFIQSNAELSISNYFSVEAFFEFILFNLFIGGMVFQTPLIVVMANRVGILKKEWLLKSRRMAIIVILVIASIVTPDHSIISMLALGIVMMLLYELSLFFCK